MKNVFKNILSAVLALAMAFGTLIANAASGESIYRNGEEFICAGGLKEGCNTISCPGGKKSPYVKFNAEKDGYYVFVYEPKEYYTTEWLTLAETDKNSEITDYVMCDYSLYHSDMAVTLYELEAGENNFILTIWESEKAHEEKITVAYMGTQITEIDFSAGTEYSLISGIDIYENHYNLVDSDYQYRFYTNDVVIAFDTYKTLEFEDAHIDCESETEITDGVYDIGVYFGKKTIPAKIEVHPITHYIENVEADNPEKFITVEYYDGYKIALPYEGTYTVTFKNGEKITTNKPIVIPGANPMCYGIYKIVNHDKNSATIGFSHKVLFESYECTVKAATTEQNFDYMTQKISYIISDFKQESSYLFDEIVNADSNADSIKAFGIWISYIATDLICVFSDIIGDLFEFAVYTVLHL